MIFASSPSLEVDLETNLISDIQEVFMVHCDGIHFTIDVPHVFHELFEGGKGYEIAASQAVQPVKLFYRSNYAV